MIREILEKNNVMAKLQITEVLTTPQNQTVSYAILNDELENTEIEENCIYCISDNTEKTKELLAREYVKQNGFKLSWLDKTINGYEWIINCFKALLEKEETYLISVNDNDIWKLWCWLYANDIKIINDLEE